MRILCYCKFSQVNFFFDFAKIFVIAWNWNFWHWQCDDSGSIIKTLPNMVHQSTFRQQLKATLVRNWRLKIRDSRKTLMEVLIPLYTLGTLIVLKILIPNPNFPAILEPRGDGKIFEHFSWTKNHTIAVLPHGNTSRHQTIQVSRSGTWQVTISINLCWWLSVLNRCQCNVAHDATQSGSSEDQLANLRIAGRAFVVLLAGSTSDAIGARLPQWRSVQRSAELWD